MHLKIARWLFCVKRHICDCVVVVVFDNGSNNSTMHHANSLNSIKNEEPDKNNIAENEFWHGFKPRYSQFKGCNASIDWGDNWKSKKKHNKFPYGIKAISFKLKPIYMHIYG